MKKSVFRLCVVTAVFASLSLFATGCAKKAVRTDEGAATGGAAAAVEQQAPPATSASHGEAMGGEEALASSGGGDSSQQAFSEGRTTGPLLPVYFDFDRSDIRADQKGRITGNADYLKEHSSASIRIEGNCDERGTNEYNMALGERRAMAAKKYLMNMGIDESRLQTVSYGEEKPFVNGHDETSWSQNRRDDFVFTGR